MNEFVIEKNRIYLPGYKEDIAYGNFDEDEEVIIVNKIFVAEEYRGTGQKLGERLMEEIINYSKSKGKKINPRCSYAKHYGKKYNLKDIFVE
ncbi:MAG: GNAT family N-acetyltransferase [Tissierellia bacterium]|nr:GNAT family N-acetyltransferase [Tissierellia bacterium]